MFVLQWLDQNGGTLIECGMGILRETYNAQSAKLMHEVRVVTSLTDYPNHQPIPVAKQAATAMMNTIQIMRIVGATGQCFEGEYEASIL